MARINLRFVWIRPMGQVGLMIISAEWNFNTRSVEWSVEMINGRCDRIGWCFSDDEYYG